MAEGINWQGAMDSARNWVGGAIDKFKGPAAPESGVTPPEPSAAAPGGVAQPPKPGTGANTPAVTPPEPIPGAVSNQGLSGANRSFLRRPSGFGGGGFFGGVNLLLNKGAAKDSLKASPQDYYNHLRSTGANKPLEQELTQRGVEITPENVSSAALTRYMSEIAQGELTPDNTAELTSMAMRFASSENPMLRVQANQILSQVVPNVLARQGAFGDENGQGAWDEGQWSSYKNTLAAKFFPPDMLASIPGNAADHLAAAAGNIANETQANIAKAMDLNIQQKPNETGFTNWLMENPSTLMAVGGLIAFAFGGNTGKALGLLAMAGGGYGLYQRYQNLQDPVIADAIQQSAQAVDADGNPIPFQNIDEIAARYGQQFGEEYADKVRTGITDFGMLARAGFRNKIAEMVNQRAKQTIAGFMGPHSAIGETKDASNVKQDPMAIVSDVTNNLMSRGPVRALQGVESTGKLMREQAARMAGSQ